jgi:hypothetical protein
MTDATAAFFDELGRRKHDPSLERVGGSIRFEVIDDRRTDTWLVAIEDGDIAVSYDDDAAAACLVRAERRLFDAIVTGEANVMAAVLRGALGVRGDPELMVRFRRLLASPPSAAVRGDDDGSDER